MSSASLPGNPQDYTLLDQLIEGVLLLNAEGRRVYANAAAARLLGYATPDALPGAVTDLAWIDEADHPVPAAALPSEQIRAGAEQAEAVFGYCAPAGSARTWLRVVAYSQRDAAGSRTGIVTLLQDETDRRNAAAAEDRAARLYRATLLDAERFATTLASIGDAVIATDTSGVITFLNPVATRLTGWEAAEALGQDIDRIFVIINRETRQPVGNPVTRVLREGVAAGLANHTMLIARDGTNYAIDDTAAPIRDSDGVLQGVVLVFRDVTAREQAESAQAHLAAIVESSGDAIFSKDLDGILTSWNAAATRLYGYLPEEVIGRSVSLLMPPDYADDLPIIMGRISRGERVERYETVRQRKDGTLLDISLIVSPVRDRTGQITGASVIAHDITELKRAAKRQAEIALENARLYEEAQAAIGMRDQFLVVAAHELRTPLTSLLAAVQLMQRRLGRSGRLAEPDTRALQIVTTQANRLNRLISGLLDIARLQTGRLSLESAPLDLGALVGSTLADLEPMLSDHPLDVELPADPVWIEGDALRLEQVLVNLVGNAAKYSAAGAPIRVRLVSEGAQVYLHVSDQGIGVPASALPYLFSRFYRASNVDSSTSGMGIGLYVVKEIVTLHGGTITVDAVEGQGSTFTVCLPAGARP
jgi:PAS domain S-box-containing protein